ncbi:DUF3320 domain-containing protein [Brucella pituitosa]|uniref:DUF3320 domain-containing protein n=1 Tax=Brucella pituitosa TaxID=571256 RepID=A0ABS3K163_9HYPH|nr:DUF3320 domain-containing protein [Brucella pituitosa]MBO1040666.1 DUF3320 domain-containing protein [Brucella pituitosa]
MDQQRSESAKLAENSAFSGSLSVEDKIERARTELLDLSARNRLLNVPRFSKSAKTVDIVDEKAAEVFRILVTEGKAMTFLAGAKGREKTGEDADGEELIELALPDDDERDEQGKLVRHGDTKLQTKMTPNALQKRLLDLYFDARTLEEEQGVNILFLGLGTLKWIDPNNKENIRYAPLILVPVILERGTAGERFKLRARQEDFSSNLSLEALLDRVHSIKMPEFEATDDFSFEDYAQRIASCIAVKPDWSVQPDDIVLGFFSFAKFLMYRDLDPSLWPAHAKFTDTPLIRSLVSDGFERDDDLISDEANIDTVIQPSEMTHIVDADSSQSAAIHEVRRGKNLVIQGPPGTGKSQTIANIIASAVADGKTVLFVAEKMAALEVVKRRLDAAGVGEACLELHSNKANKKAVLHDLQKTWDLGSPRGNFDGAIDNVLLDLRDRLNDHPKRLHRLYEPYRLSAYTVIGHLSRLRREGIAPSDIELHNAIEWTPGHRDEVSNLLMELAERIRDIGLPSQHPWRGVGITGISPLDLERLAVRIQNSSTAFAELLERMQKTTTALQRADVVDLQDYQNCKKLADRLASCPDTITNEALSNGVWASSINDIASLVQDGKKLANVAEKINEILTSEAWGSEPAGLVSQFSRVPANFSDAAFTTVEQLRTLMPRLLTAVRSLQALLGIDDIGSLASIERMVVIGQRVANAPDASPDAFVAAIWERGLDQAGDLAEAVATLQNARSELTGKVTDHAWEVDLVAARTALAVHGKRMLKFLSGDWRSARSLLKTVLVGEPSVDETLRILDVLQKGKQARSTIRDGDALGRSAFGADWRGEKTDPKPLEDLVLWMRSLRGVSTEARQIASRLSNKAAVGTSAEQVQGILEEARRLTHALWLELSDKTQILFPGATGAEDAHLSQVLRLVDELGQAEQEAKTLLKRDLATAGERSKIFQVLGLALDLKAKVDSQGTLLASAFGQRWEGIGSDWDALSLLVDWVQQNADIRPLAATIADRGDLARKTGATLDDAGTWVGEFSAILDYLQTDPETLFGANRVEEVPCSELQERLQVWLTSREQLSKWTAYRNRANAANDAAAELIVERLEDGRVTPDGVMSYFEMAFYEAILRDQHRHDPELARFDGEVHGRLVNEFARLDMDRMGLSRLEVVRSHHKRIPGKSGVGPVGVLRSEMARRRGHMPIRQLMTRAAPAIQALKPVFMMSPLSIAQFLPPAQLTFDLLVMDEASQIQPVDAIGAVARARQVVVVGDERQLPPTRFFSKMTSSGSEDDDELEGAQVSDIESILGLFSARGLPEKMLRWHYRSRHQSLIAVSNSEFYENKLFIVPSPYTHEAGMGLRFHQVPGGTFEEGVNKTEAKAVAKAIIKHALENPNQSLGVAAFSIKQRREIQDQLEILRRLNPETEAFFHSHPTEPFFIKNLENVQGDERDVIFISVAYARNAQGYMGMRFGPLGAEGGERRLNVLISRAKQRCEVYASITDEDIDLERARGKGVAAFKLFLHFARTGRLSLSKRTEREMDSVFEEQVAAALTERGYQVHPQVGIAGFFIDLAVADDAVPGRYLLGIECDGAAYHDSRSARDRDRLRQAVLEAHGWNIHRIWSTDWFQRPNAELEKLIAAIERAKANTLELEGDTEKKRKAVNVEIITIDREDVTEIGLLPKDVIENATPLYKEASIRPAIHVELHETPLGTLVEHIKEIVEVEGPLHQDELVTRLRSAWGLQRAGQRINSHVTVAILAAARNKHINIEGQFLLWPNGEIKLRDRSEVTSLSLRRLDMLPPMEIDQGLRQLVEASFGATPDEAINAISRALGFKSTSGQLREHIQARIGYLKKANILEERDGLLTLTTT